MINEVTKQDLEEFRLVSDRLIKTNLFDGMSDLINFLNYIDKNLIITNYIQGENKKNDYDFRGITKAKGLGKIILPMGTKEKNYFILNLLKYAASEYSDYYQLAIGYSLSVYIQDSITSFNNSVIKPFIMDIRYYLEKAMEEER